MAIEIVPAGRTDLPDIERFIAGETGVATESQLSMRERNWLPGNESFGLRLLANGELVGFLGASYSLRPIDGAWEKFCAIAPWYVREAYRSHSLPMLFKLLADKSVTYVNLTPTRPMFTLFARLGFATLDDTKLLIPPVFNLAGLRPWRGCLLTDPATVREVLKGPDLKTYDDHVGTRCLQLAIVDGERTCHVAASRRVLRNLTFSELLHVSEPSMLGPQLERVVWLLCRHFRAVGIAADARLLAGADVRAIRYKLNSPPLFLSPRIGREKINNMWSELAY
jgi:hypothetical protein